MIDSVERFAHLEKICQKSSEAKKETKITLFEKIANSAIQRSQDDESITFKVSESETLSFKDVFDHLNDQEGSLFRKSIARGASIFILYLMEILSKNNDSKYPELKKFLNSTNKVVSEDLRREMISFCQPYLKKIIAINSDIDSYILEYKNFSKNNGVLGKTNFFGNGSDYSGLTSSLRKALNIDDNFESNQHNNSSSPIFFRQGMDTSPATANAKKRKYSNPIDIKTRENPEFQFQNGIENSLNSTSLDVPFFSPSTHLPYAIHPDPLAPDVQNKEQIAPFKQESAQNGLEEMFKEASQELQEGNLLFKELFEQNLVKNEAEIIKLIDKIPAHHTALLSYFKRIGLFRFAKEDNEKESNQLDDFPGALRRAYFALKLNSENGLVEFNLEQAKTNLTKQADGQLIHSEMIKPDFDWSRFLNYSWLDDVEKPYLKMHALFCETLGLTNEEQLVLDDSGNLRADVGAKIKLFLKNEIRKLCHPQLRQLQFASLPNEFWQPASTPTQKPLLELNLPSEKEKHSNDREIATAVSYLCDAVVKDSYIDKTQNLANVLVQENPFEKIDNAILTIMRESIQKHIQQYRLEAQPDAEIVFAKNNTGVEKNNTKKIHCATLPHAIKIKGSTKDACQSEVKHCFAYFTLGKNANGETVIEICNLIVYGISANGPFLKIGIGNLSLGFNISSLDQKANPTADTLEKFYGIYNKLPLNQQAIVQDIFVLISKEDNIFYGAGSDRRIWRCVVALIIYFRIRIRLDEMLEEQKNSNKQKNIEKIQKAIGKQVKQVKANVIRVFGKGATVYQTLITKSIAELQFTNLPEFANAFILSVDSSEQLEITNFLVKRAFPMVVQQLKTVLINNDEDEVMKLWAKNYPTYLSSLMHVIKLRMLFDEKPQFDKLLSEKYLMLDINKVVDSTIDESGSIGKHLKQIQLLQNFNKKNLGFVKSIFEQLEDNMQNEDISFVKNILNDIKLQGNYEVSFQFDTAMDGAENGGVDLVCRIHDAKDKENTVTITARMKLNQTQESKDKNETMTTFVNNFVRNFVKKFVDQGKQADGYQTEFFRTSNANHPSFILELNGITSGKDAGVEVKTQQNVKKQGRKNVSFRLSTREVRDAQGVQAQIK